jgi:hypothetical protein
VSPVTVGADAVPSWFAHTLDAAVELANHRYPYVFGGGHNPQFAPSIGLTNGSDGEGYDCSSYASTILRGGRILDHPSGPLGTHELEDWGQAGVGEWLTLWVVNGYVNGVPTEHCVTEFMKGVSPELRFAVAAHTGTICEFIPSFDTSQYHARRRA